MTSIAGGSSGSPVYLGDGLSVIGLHHSGDYAWVCPVCRARKSAYKKTSQGWVCTCGHVYDSVKDCDPDIDGANLPFEELPDHIAAAPDGINRSYGSLMSKIKEHAYAILQATPFESMCLCLSRLALIHPHPIH